jgi:regulator of sirC expression with transglutaminase-like and TPR domain
MDRSLGAFARAVGTPDAGLDLARAALLIAEIEHPGLPVDDYLRALDRLADRSGAGRPVDRLHRLHRLREFLFEEEGFRGNVDDYYDPRNSCLNDVLDRRLGIPITLALVLIEVGRRVGLEIAGIGLPGHFVVSARVGSETVLLDPFDGGALLTRAGCAHLASRALGRRVALKADLFVPVTKRQFLVRMLTNLKTIYWRREDWSRALAVIDRLLAVDPALVGEVRDRGTALARLGELGRGLADWERYLTERPEAPDAAALRRDLRRARMILASRN